jgi:5-methylthioadenosine/S-adenosylhomocysteine deaminase
MSEFLVRGKYVVVDADAPVIKDGAVIVANGRIQAIGPYAALADRAAGLAVLGSESHIVFPGLVNSHSHGKGFSSFELGFADETLEMWLLERKAQRQPNIYWDTLLAATQLLESGVTTVLHNHVTRAPVAFEAELDLALAAYQDAGLRVAFAPDIRCRNNFVYEPDAVFASKLPQPLQKRFLDYAAGLDPIRLDRYLAAFDSLAARVGVRGEKHRLLFGPMSLQWTGDEEMRTIAKRATELETGLHVHIQETPYQRDLGPRLYGHSLVRQMHELGALTPMTTLGHAVWLSDDDIELMAKSGASYAHNPSSNLRLKSGISPVIRAMDRGVNVALGSDSMTINDDDDFVQEMRLAAKLHRPPGIYERDLSSRDVLRMATTNGRKVVLFEEAGALRVGGPADMVTMRASRMLGRVPEPGADAIDTLLYRAKRDDIDHVLVAGETLVANGVATQMDKQRISEELCIDAQRFDRAQSAEVRSFMRELRPYVHAFYDDWFRERGEPHYIYNSRG